MLILGHVGITLGVVRSGEAAAGELLFDGRETGSKSLDYRFLAFGALLPDIIDKPVGLLILPERLGTTQSIGHTLIFSLVFLIIGCLAYRHNGKLPLLSLAIGCIGHLILDGMWSRPDTLLWPTLGSQFSFGDHRGLLGYLPELWPHAGTYPWIALSEVIGGWIIGYWVLKLRRERRLRYFVKHGVLAESRVLPLREL